MIDLKQVKDYIEAIERRIAHLSKRIDGPGGEHFTFDRSERAALRFAAEHLKSCAFVIDEPPRPRAPGGFISRQDRGEGVQK
jgi:hypothetical protein